MRGAGFNHVREIPLDTNGGSNGTVLALLISREGQNPMATRGYHDGSGRVSHYDPSLTSDHASNLWHDCPLLEYIHDPTIGFLHDERFEDFDSTDIWTVTQATTGTAAISTAAPGVLEIDSNSTTATQGANVQRTGGPVVVPAAGKDIWFETKIKVVDTYDKCEFFLGLSEVDTAILDTSAMASTNVLAFWCVTDNGVVLFGGEKAGTGATETGPTIAEATYIKLGFKVTGVTSAQMYVNGVAYGDPIETANIPIVALYPSFVCQSGGTNDPILHIAGYRLFQLR